MATSCLAETVSRVLLIDENRRNLEDWGVLLRRAGYDVLAADCAQAGLMTVREHGPDVIVCELLLPDYSGLEFLRTLRANGSVVPPFIMMAASGTVRSAVEAFHLGAIEYLEKPLRAEQILRVVERALAERRRPQIVTSPTDSVLLQAHAAARWAQAVVKVIDAPNDPRTFAGWSRIANASPGTLKNWCRTAGLPGKRSLDFARMLRAVVRASSDGWRPQDSLNAVDTRTLKRLLALGAVGQDTKTLPRSIDDFLVTQSFITDSHALLELRRALRLPHGDSLPY